MVRLTVIIFVFASTGLEIVGVCALGLLSVVSLAERRVAAAVVPLASNKSHQIMAGLRLSELWCKASSLIALLAVTTVTRECVKSCARTRAHFGLNRFIYIQRMHTWTRKCHLLGGAL